MTIYSERYVVFLDILGFGQLVAESHSDPRKAEDLYFALHNKWEVPLREGRQVDLQMQSFSDSIVISARASHDGLAGLLTLVGDVTRWMLSARFLTRGGIAKGLLYHAGTVMFGPAFLDAYRIEQTIADVPRIVPTREVYHDFMAMDSGKRSAIVMSLDEDGPPYLDVLSHFWSVNQEGQPAPGLVTEATSCRVQLETLLSASIFQPRHYYKVRWLAKKWNDALAGNIRRVAQIEFVGSDVIAWTSGG